MTQQVQLFHCLVVGLLVVLVAIVGMGVYFLSVLAADFKSYYRLVRSRILSE